MDEKINQEIIKEKTITYGCKDGYHLYSPSSSMMESLGGVVYLKLKCMNCGAEVRKDSPISGLSIPDSPARAANTDDSGVMERVPDTSKHGEPTLSPNPYEEINNRSTQRPRWAEEVQARYNQDKQLDDFFARIKKSAIENE